MQVHCIQAFAVHANAFGSHDAVALELQNLSSSNDMHSNGTLLELRASKRWRLWRKTGTVFAKTDKTGAARMKNYWPGWLLACSIQTAKPKPAGALEKRPSKKSTTHPKPSKAQSVPARKKVTLA